jgi:NTE family protein
MAAEERTALVLSGGGLRGSAHVGILKTFQAIGLLAHVDVIVGTSAGAIVGAMLASGTSVEQIEQAALALGRLACDDLLDPNTPGLQTALCTGDLGRFSGLLQGQPIVNLVERNLTYLKSFTDYASLPGPQRPFVKDLLVVAVDLDSGRKVVFCDPARYTYDDEVILCGHVPIALAARASGSGPVYLVPLAVTPSPSCGCAGPPVRYYVDGAVRDNCPLRLAVRLAGCTRVIAINLGYAGERVEHVAERGVVEVVNQSIAFMGAQQLDADIAFLRKEVADGDLHLSAYVLNPHIWDMGTFDFDRIAEGISRGEEAAEWFLSQVHRQTPYIMTDGAFDPDAFFGRQGIFTYTYPDPDAPARRQRLMAARAVPRRPASPCDIPRTVGQLSLLTAITVAVLSLAMILAGGALALRLAGVGAAQISDMVIFMDGGILSLFVGWITIGLALRWWICRRSG